MTKPKRMAKLKDTAITASLLTLVMLPFAPSAYAFYRIVPECFASPEGWGCEHLPAIMLVAPLAIFIGPITHDEDPPLNPWPGVLLTAALLAAIWWIASQLVRISIEAVRLRRRPPTTGPQG
jgi:hypothetical protein